MHGEIVTTIGRQGPVGLEMTTSGNRVIARRQLAARNTYLKNRGDLTTVTTFNGKIVVHWLQHDTHLKAVRSGAAPSYSAFLPRMLGEGSCNHHIAGMASPALGQVGHRASQR